MLLSSTLSAQHRFSVTVRDSVSGRPVPSVLILDTRGGYLAETGSHGKAWFESNVPEVMIALHLTGYKKKLSYVSAGNTSDNLVLISPDTSYIPEAIVSDSRVVQNLSKSALRNTTFRRSSEMESLLPATNTAQDLLENLSTTQTLQDPVLGSSVGLNGLGGQNVKLLLDGQPVTGRMSGNIDLSQFSLSDVQEVQVYFGPQSIIYGSDASGGIINLISFIHNQKTSGYIQSYIEDIKRYNFDGHVDFTVHQNHFGLKLGRYYFDGLSFYDTLERKKNWLPKEQYFLGGHWRKNWQLAKGVLMMHLRNDYTLEHLYNPGEPEVSNTQMTATAFDQTYITQRDNASFTVSYWGQKWKHNLQNSYSYFQRRTKNYFLDFVQDQKTELDNTASNFDQFSLMQSRYIAQRVSDKLGVQTGAELTLEQGEGDKLKGQKNREEFAVFGILDYRLEGWHLVPGLRWSYFSGNSSKFLPAIQIYKQLSDKWYVETGYAYTYRVPSLKEFYLSFVDANHNITGNPDLLPESTQALNAGIKFQIDALRYTLDIKLSSAYYTTQDQIVLASDISNPTAYTYRNIEDITNTSQILDISYSPYIEGHELEISSGTNWLYFIKYGNAQNLQSWGQSFRINWQPKRWKAGLSLSSKTSIGQRVFVIDADSIVDRELLPFTMLNLGLSKNFWQDKMVVEIGCKNILAVQQVDFKDNKGSVGIGGSAHGTSDANMMASPGRAFYLRVGYKF